MTTCTVAFPGVSRLTRGVRIFCFSLFIKSSKSGNLRKTKRQSEQRAEYHSYVSSALQECQLDQKEPRCHLFNFIVWATLWTTVEFDTKATIRTTLQKGGPRFLASSTSSSQGLNKRSGTKHYLFLRARKGNPSKSCCMVNCALDALQLQLTLKRNKKVSLFFRTGYVVKKKKKIQTILEEKSKN